MGGGLGVILADVSIERFLEVIVEYTEFICIILHPWIRVILPNPRNQLGPSVSIVRFSFNRSAVWRCFNR